MTSLRVILVMIEPPLPFSSAVAGWHDVLLRGLVARGHRVTAFVACSKPDEVEKAHRLFPSPGFDLRAYPFPRRSGAAAKLATLLRPYSYMFSAEFQGDLAGELARGYDILHLEQMPCGWLGLDHTGKALLTIHNLYSIDLDRSQVGRFEIWLMARTERRLLRAYSQFVALSERLADSIRRTNPRASVAVVPLGVDPALYPYITDDQRTVEPIISVIGNMNWSPSRSAAIRLLRRLWPGIKAEVPQARVQVVGWGAKGALREFDGATDVTIIENVPAIQPYFARTGVLVYAPTRGSGMKVKVLESLGFGVPVVTTSEGVEGLPAVDGVHAGIAEDDAGLIRRTVDLLRDPARQNRQRAAGRALLERYCGPEPTVAAIEQLHARMRAGGSSAGQP